VIEIQVGDRIIFTEPGFPLTGKRGRAVFTRGFAVTVEFSERGQISTSTWRRDYLLPLKDKANPPSCGAI